MCTSVKECLPSMYKALGFDPALNLPRPKEKQKENLSQVWRVVQATLRTPEVEGQGQEFRVLLCCDFKAIPGYVNPVSNTQTKTQSKTFNLFCVF